MLKGLLQAGRASLGRSKLRCSFCTRDAASVPRLVAGAKAYICDACISECVAVLQDHGGFTVPVRDCAPEPVQTR